MNGMLRKSDIDWVLCERDEWLADPKKRTRVRYRDKRIRDKTKRGIEHLAFLARHLDPSQHRQIFEWDIMKPVLEELFEYAMKDDLEDSEYVKNIRLFKLFINIGSSCLKHGEVLLSSEFHDLMLLRGYIPLPSTETMNKLKIAYNAVLSTERT